MAVLGELGMTIYKGLYQRYDWSPSLLAWADLLTFDFDCFHFPKVTVVKSCWTHHFQEAGASPSAASALQVEHS